MECNKFQTGITMLYIRLSAYVFSWSHKMTLGGMN